MTSFLLSLNNQKSRSAGILPATARQAKGRLRSPLCTFEVGVAMGHNALAYMWRCDIGGMTSSY